MKRKGADNLNLSGKFGTIVRRIPIDFEKIAEETGCRSGRIVKSPIFGWGIQNTNNVEDQADFTCIEPPKMAKNEKLLRIENNEWCFYA